MDRKQKLEEIAQEIASCRRCLLYKDSINPVPGEGNPEAEIVCIGEAPGYWEDQQGRPFVGPAGKLLSELLALAKVSREETFITNVVKHRPPNNRLPLPGEINSCRDYLQAQIKIINPKIIITLGRIAMRQFLQTDFISQVHGKMFRDKKGRIIIPMYHPAAALRSKKIMEEIKNDFQKLGQFLNKLKKKS